jgi:hypothetical protein
MVFSCGPWLLLSLLLNSKFDYGQTVFHYIAGFRLLSFESDFPASLSDHRAFRRPSHPIPDPLNIPAGWHHLTFSFTLLGKSITSPLLTALLKMTNIMSIQGPHYLVRSRRPGNSPAAGRLFPERYSSTLKRNFRKQAGWPPACSALPIKFTCILCIKSIPFR